jgi:hypothetical protein
MKQLAHQNRSRGLRSKQARHWMAAREGRKISQDEVAVLMTEGLRRRGIERVIHQTRISRIESGREPRSLYETEAMVAVTGTPDAFRAFTCRSISSGPGEGE